MQLLSTYHTLQIHGSYCVNNFQVESLTNQEEVELRAKIEALGLEVRKLPSKSAQNLNEVDGLHWQLYILMIDVLIHLCASFSFG